MKKSVFTIIFATLALVSARGAILFTETFGSLADGTAITTSNTSFTYVRASTGASPILEAQSPSSFTGSSALLAATNASLTGVGVLTGTYSAFDVGVISLDVQTPSAFETNQTLFVGVGTGNTTFTSNAAFNSTELTGAFQIFNGQIQVRSAANAWVNIGSPLTAATSYSIMLYFNGSASTYDYGSGTMAAATGDLYVNGSLVGDDVSVRDAVSASAFRLYTTTVTAGKSYEIDNVVLESDPVPEPSTLVSLLGGVGMLIGFRRLRGSYGSTRREPASVR